jgi:hypothetical protein
MRQNQIAVNGCGNLNKRDYQGNTFAKIDQLARASVGS